MKIALVLINGLILAIAARWANKKLGTQNSRLFWSAFAFHIVCAMAVGLVYLYYYNLDDTWTLFKDAEILANFAKSNWEKYLVALWDDDALIAKYVIISNEEWRSVFFVKILSVLCLITGNNYWFCAAYLSFLSFLAAWNLYSVIYDWKPQAGLAAAVAFLFFPSVVFWSSGIEKETLALAGVFFLAASIIRFGMTGVFRLKDLPIILISVLLVWKLRYFWLAVLLLVGIPTVVIVYLNNHGFSRLKIAIIAVTVVVLATVSIPFIHPNFTPEVFLQVVVQNNRELVRLSTPQKIIHFHQLTPDWGSVLVNSPLALVSGLYRPFIWEAISILGLFASIENFLLLALTIIYLLNFRKMINKQNKIIFLGTLAYVCILCIFLTLSTPNFGTLSRYRIGFLPFFVFIISYKNPLLVSIEQFTQKRR